MEADAAKKRLRESALKKSSQIKAGIERILKNEPDALHANNL